MHLFLTTCRSIIVQVLMYYKIIFEFFFKFYQTIIENQVVMVSFVRHAISKRAFKPTTAAQH